MKRRRLAVLSLSFLAIFVLLFGLLYFFRDYASRKGSGESAERATAVIRGFLFTSEKDGRTDWRIRADLARKPLDREEVYIERIEGEFTPKDGVLVSFRGDHGTIDLSSGRCSLSSPRLTYNREYQFETDEMEIDLKQSLARTTRPLSISASGLDLKGLGLLGKLREGLISIDRNVKGSVLVQRGRYSFEAQRFTYDVGRDVYLLEGSARVRGQGVDLSCEKLSLMRKDGTIERMEAQGRVRIIFEGVVAEGGSALFDLKEDRIYLTDSPHIREGQRESKGDAIIYDRKRGTYFVKGPKVRIER